ncbi:MAG TPA: hypothetical protein VFZ64_01260 [Nocardioidaceae bacterium]
MGVVHDVRRMKDRYGGSWLTAWYRVHRRRRIAEELARLRR